MAEAPPSNYDPATIDALFTEAQRLPLGHPRLEQIARELSLYVELIQQRLDHEQELRRAQERQSMAPAR